MTCEEFAQGYAERSGVTVEWLRANGRRAAPCDCGQYYCDGWQMARVEDTCLRCGHPWDRHNRWGGIFTGACAYCDCNFNLTVPPEVIAF